MAIRERLNVLPQPLRWLAAHTATMAALAAAAVWLGARTTERVSLPPVSSDWLLDMERKSIRGQY